MPSIQFVSPSPDLKQDVNRDHDRDHFRQGKFQVHRSPEKVGEKNQHGRDEKRDLQAGAEIAIPTLRSILFFIAMRMAVECSAALPTIATTITPTNTSVRPTESRTLSIVPTRNSESRATKAVAMSRMITALLRDHCLSCSFAFLSPGRDPCGSEERTPACRSRSGTSRRRCLTRASARPAGSSRQGCGRRRDERPSE
jgi:hypothetical protein